MIQLWYGEHLTLWQITKIRHRYILSLGWGQDKGCEDCLQNAGPGQGWIYHKRGIYPGNPKNKWNHSFWLEIFDALSQ